MLDYHLVNTLYENISIYRCMVVCSSEEEADIVLEDLKEMGYPTSTPQSFNPDESRILVTHKAIAPTAAPLENAKEFTVVIFTDPQVHKELWPCMGHLFEDIKLIAFI